MRRVRFSIAGLMVAWRCRPWWSPACGPPRRRLAGAAMTLLVVAECSVWRSSASLCRRGSERTWWLGFALFGCGYLVLAFWSETTSQLADDELAAVSQLEVRPKHPASGLVGAGHLHWTYLQIAHCLWALVAASLGGVLATVSICRSGARARAAIVETHPAARCLDVAAQAGGHLAFGLGDRRVGRSWPARGRLPGSGPAWSFC